MAKNKKEFDPFIIMCEADGLPCPEPEVYFAKHLKRKWAFDYLFDGWLALEVEGGAYGVGKKCPVCGQRKNVGHKGFHRFKADMEKYNTAASLGYVIIRCLPEDIRSGEAVNLVKWAMDTRMGVENKIG